MEKPFSAYRGEDPYVFVCYAHVNDQIVYPEIEWLKQQGVNVWYDEGISAGKIWRSEVGEAIGNASRIIFYISEASLASDHCSREINFALDELIDVIPVYLEEIILTTDLQVGLGSVQALHREQDPRYREHLLGAVREVSHGPVKRNQVTTAPQNGRSPLGMILVATLFVAISVAWWLLSPQGIEPDGEMVYVVIEPFTADSETAIGLEYEIRRLLTASPGLVARVSNGPAVQAGYKLEGQIVGDVLIAQLSGYSGESLSTWQISLSDKLSLAANTLARDLLISLGREIEVLPPQVEEIPQQTFRTYLRAMATLRRSHSLETLNTALAGFSDVIDKVPRYAPAHAGLCNTYLSIYLEYRDKSNIQLAEVHCHRALTLGGQDPKVHNALGMLYRETGQEQKAIDSFNRSLELAPYSSDAMVGLADTLVKTGAESEAETWYQEAIKVDPGHWENYHALGVHQFSDGNFELALETFQTAFALAPNEFRILNNIGAGNFMIGDYEQAAEYWRQAVKLQPSAPMYANLGTSYFFQREFRHAADMYKEAHNQAPNNHRHLGQIAEVYYVSSLGDYEDYFRQAISLALDRLDIDPKDHETVAMIASYYAGLGDAENAKVFLKRAQSNASLNVNAVYFLVVSYARLGDIESAGFELANLIRLGYERKLIELDANFDELLAVLEENST